MAARKFTYKMQLIGEIGIALKHSSLEQIPLQCLEDMSTSSLVEFKKWIEPIIQANPGHTKASHQLGAKGK